MKPSAVLTATQYYDDSTVIEFWNFEFLRDRICVEKAKEKRFALNCSIVEIVVTTHEIRLILKNGVIIKLQSNWDYISAQIERRFELSNSASYELLPDLLLEQCRHISISSTTFTLLFESGRAVSVESGEYPEAVIVAWPSDSEYIMDRFPADYR